MASGFPGSIDSFTNPLSNSALNSPSHAGQHQDLNDAVNKVETYMGLVKVIPTSGVNCTISATGTITVIGGSSSASVNGCFTSLYANYLVELVMVISTGAEVRVRFRSAGTDETTSHYGAISRIQPNSASLTVTQNNGGTYYLLSDSSVSADLRGRVEFYSPQIATTTYATHQLSGAGATMYNYNGGDYHTQATSYDGFTIYPSTGTITSGTIRVYGYRN